MIEKDTNLQALENVKHQLGFCGIWCGSCIVGNGTLTELTKKYKDLIVAYGLPEWGPKDFDHDEFTKGLDSLEEIAPCAGCLKGGGRDHCEMRICASHRKLPDCTACADFPSCEHADILQHIRKGALEAGLFVKEKGGDRSERMTKWADELKSIWPCCILFLDDHYVIPGDGKKRE
jgi:hypothetical protein